MKKRIKGFPNYSVDEDGNIYSSGRYKNGVFIRKEIMLKQSSNSDGYKLVNLFTNSTGKVKRFTALVHRIVAQAFIDNPDKKLTVNHIDGNKENNVKDNLEWATHKENNVHAYKLGLKKGQIGSTNGMSKLVEADVINMITDILNGSTNEELSEKYSVHPRYVSLIRHKRRWEHVWNTLFKDSKIIKSNKPRPNNIPGKSKISLDKQIEIIGMIKNGLRLKELAEKYNIDPSVLSRVRSGKAWGHAMLEYNLRNVQRLSKATA